MGKRGQKLKKIFSGAVFWSGAVLIGIIAVPVMLLAAAVCLVVKTADFLMRKIDSE